jgi:hypothetical protein
VFASASRSVDLLAAVKPPHAVSIDLTRTDYEEAEPQGQSLQVDEAAGYTPSAVKSDHDLSELFPCDEQIVIGVDTRLRLAAVGASKSVENVSNAGAAWGWPRIKLLQGLIMAGKM